MSRIRSVRRREHGPQSAPGRASRAVARGRRRIHGGRGGGRGEGSPLAVRVAGVVVVLLVVLAPAELFLFLALVWCRRARRGTSVNSSNRVGALLLPVPTGNSFTSPVVGDFCWCWCCGLRWPRSSPNGDDLAAGSSPRERQRHTQQGKTRYFNNCSSGGEASCLVNLQGDPHGWEKGLHIYISSLSLSLSLSHTHTHTHARTHARTHSRERSRLPSGGNDMPPSVLPLATLSARKK